MNVLRTMVSSGTAEFATDSKMSSASWISSIALRIWLLRSAVSWIIKTEMTWDTPIHWKQNVFKDACSPLATKLFGTISHMIMKMTPARLIIFRNADHHPSKQENANPWNFFVSGSISIRNGINPLSWQIRMNGCNFASPFIGALTTVRTSDQLRTKCFLGSEQFMPVLVCRMSNVCLDIVAMVTNKLTVYDYQWYYLLGGT